MSVEEVSNDKRGNMIKVTWLGKTYWILFTKKGYGRGGEYHPSAQHNMVISGSIIVKMKVDALHGYLYGSEERYKVPVGETITIPANIAHVLLAQEDSIVIEWHDEELPPFDQKKIYEPYRKFCWRGDNTER